jgi:hypothetical protein
VQEVNDAVIAASNGALKGVMTVTNYPLVSSDLNHDPHSATILLDQTKVMDGNFVNVLGMDVTFIIYGVVAVFVVFIAIVGVVIWRNRHEPGTGPGPSDRDHDVTSHRHDL